MGLRLKKARFAKKIGKTRQYVQKLEEAGRLVMGADGTVDVEASEIRIAQTADPNRDDVVQRNHRQREKNAQNASEDEFDEYEAQNGSYAQHRAKKEGYLALMAEMEYQKARGFLVDAASVQRAAQEIGALVRQRVEAMPDLLAPELALIADMGVIHARLVEYGENLLQDLAREMDR